MESRQRWRALSAPLCDYAASRSRSSSGGDQLAAGDEFLEVVAILQSAIVDEPLPEIGRSFRVETPGDGDLD